jgi:hypothetical protein
MEYFPQLTAHFDRLDGMIAELRQSITTLRKESADAWLIAKRLIEKGQKNG